MAVHYYQFMREFGKDLGRYTASTLSSQLGTGTVSCYIICNFVLEKYGNIMITKPNAW